LQEVTKIIDYAGRGIIPLFTRARGFRKAVVTGGSGFIGSNLLAALERSPHVWTIEITKEDYEDRERLEEKIRGADFIFHFAGVHTGDKTAYEFNTRSTKALLDALRRCAPRALFVFASSFAVYRVPRRGEVVDERFPCEPRNDYGASKFAAERIIATYADRYGIRSAILRISNVYGRKQKPSDSFIDTAVRALREGSIFEVRLSVEETRDFIYVDDVVRACIALTKPSYVSHGSEIYTICSGEETSIADLLAMMERRTKGRLRVNMPAEPIPPKAYWKGSFQKAQKRLQWHPTIHLKQGLSRLIG
jgi:nucleoside-diphosphate-sugar epimerase